MESSQRTGRQSGRQTAPKEIPSSLDLLPLGQRFGDKNKLSSRAKPNTKFMHVKSRTDTGKKPPKTLMETDELIRVTKLRGENFGRIAHNVLSKYIIQGSQHEVQNPTMSAIEQLRMGPYPAKKPQIENNGQKIILLDMRPIHDYVQGHIKNAMSFPACNVQIDYEFSKLNLFKNQPDKLIVIYLDDERHSILQAKIIFEKGFDNVYLLSGGYLIFSKENPDLIEGLMVERKLSLKRQTSRGSMK